MKEEWKLIEGSRDELERQALEAIFTNDGRFEVLLKRLEPAATGKLRVISSDSPPAPGNEQAAPAP